MNRKTKARLYKVLFLAIIIISGIILILSALRENIIFFYTPSDLKLKAPNAKTRVGGIVKPNSIIIEGTNNIFTLTDGTDEIVVHFHGSLPMLFREGQGIVAQGSLTSNGHFEAKEVLAKHDEKYIPRELADELKKKGYWKGN
ncbi:MAG: cytochrome c maturation protein CcmE [Rickettsiaceae bacterium]|jgi:cytochrome c-type biogenesis protein CcmE|nr:cytochrome c maturation protein CcmE [Rickettsiaceae bacterium]